LSTWFWAAYLLTTQTPGMSACNSSGSGSVALRDGVHAASQAPRWHGEAERDTIGGEHPVEDPTNALSAARRAAKAVACINKVTVVGAV